MRRTLWLLSTLSLIALAGGCASGGDEALPPTATLGTAPTTTAAPPPDPAVIPDDPIYIDEDYVQAVVDALFAVDAKATEVFVETRELDDEGVDFLEAIFIGEELDQQISAWTQTLEERIDKVLPGVLRHEIVELLGDSSNCVFVAADRDFSDTSTIEAPLSRTYLGITPKLEEDDPEDLNPTSWMLFSDSISADGTEPMNPCIDL